MSNTRTSLLGKRIRANSYRFMFRLYAKERQAIVTQMVEAQTSLCAEYRRIKNETDCQIPFRVNDEDILGVTQAIALFFEHVIKASKADDLVGPCKELLPHLDALIALSDTDQAAQLLADEMNTCSTVDANSLLLEWNYMISTLVEIRNKLASIISDFDHEFCHTSLDDSNTQ